MDKETDKHDIDVAPKSKPKPLGLMLAVGLGVGIVLIASLSGGNHDKATSEETIQEDRLSQVNTGLADNLAKLNQTQAVKPVSYLPETPTYQETTYFHPKERHSKEWEAREHAPSRLYAASLPQGMKDSKQNESKPASLFASHSHNSQFANTDVETATVSATHLAHPETTIVAGELFPAVLETAVDSSLPGMVRAVVAHPVYSYTGHHVLVPAGSRLIGQYTSSTTDGQKRVMVMWQRVTLPDGTIARIHSPGTDSLGRAGIAANSIDRHFMAQFSQAALLSIIGAGVANVGVSSETQYNSAAQYRAGMAQAFQESASSALDDSFPGPTLHIHQGTRINVFVASDIDFKGVWHE